MTVLTFDPAVERFFDKVLVGDDCWVWQAGTHKKGYGLFKLDGKTVKAHRTVWEFWNGPVPDGLHVLHHCDNPPCVRPDHLYLGTNQDNAWDRVRRGRDGHAKRTHCRHGHEFTPENTMFIRPRVRRCRTCHREAELRFRARHQ